MSIPDSIENERLLELLFSNSPDGFFFMMLDEPVEWGDHVDKARVLDYVFEHQHMTKVNAAILSQFNVTEPQQLLGTVPAQFFAHDVVNAKWRWRELFDRGYSHSETDERRADGTPMRIEGDYVVIHDGAGRIAGHFGIQRDVTDRHRVTEDIRASRQQLRALASRLQAVREEERTSIAREIHDELGQALTGLKLDVSWMRNRLPSEHEMVTHCASVITRIEETLGAVRRIATSLRPSVLDELGLAAAVEWQGQEFANRTGITVVTKLSMGDTVVSDQLGSSTFRILQEALTNVARHAHASHVSIGLTHDSDLLTLVVADDGVGLPPDQFPGTASLGIVGMRERALACDGVLRITGAPGSGTSVTLRVPLHAALGA
ncbi:MAG TPA: histidine kinase [Gemmatimonadales bacterium]|jgi:signal transduction histidine kinase|nr:histidine kinase [Gemmatimonadales bacterium]